MYKAKAYSAGSATSPLASTMIARRDPTEHDVQIEILFCGICHSVLHSVRNEWSSVMPTVYPIVPGHEIVGRVTKVGSAAGSAEFRFSETLRLFTLRGPGPTMTRAVQREQDSPNSIESTCNQRVDVHQNKSRRV